MFCSHGLRDSFSGDPSLEQKEVCSPEVQGPDSDFARPIFLRITNSTRAWLPPGNRNLCNAVFHFAEHQV